MNIKIKQVSKAKYLVVIIDGKLTWKQHTNMITNKVNSIRGFLQCNLKKFPVHIKSASYNSLVRPILEYACAMWSPYLKLCINDIEI